MPIYNYKCETCDHEMERVQKYDDPAPACERCEGKTARTIPTRTNFKLKGIGWARDGYEGRSNA